MGYPHYSNECHEYHDVVADFGISKDPNGAPLPRPEIVCLCGSTRFYDEFQRANYHLTMAGKIVLSVGFYPHQVATHAYRESGTGCCAVCDDLPGQGEHAKVQHGEGVGHDSAEKVMLDELHKRKIDLADWVHVLNVDGYIGESTRSEIEYATSRDKPITWFTPPQADDV